MISTMITLVLLVALVSPARSWTFSKPHRMDSEESHYTIQDIISKYKNFTDTKREISLFNEHPEYDTSCIKNALQPILSQCLKNPISDIDPKLRSITAVKLSICEFQVAQIDYPDECKIFSETYDECITAIERRSQWWTSYSGYYRTIGEICHYENIPYEKDAILDLFMDVTSHYENILEFLNDYVKMTEEFKIKSDESFKDLKKFMNEMMNDTRKNKETNDFMWDAIKDQLNQVSQISLNVTEVALSQSSSIEQNLMSFLNNVDTQYVQSITSLKEKFLDDLEERDSLMLKSFEETRNNLISLNELMVSNDHLTNNVNKNLVSSMKASKKLNGTIQQMDNNVHELNEDVVYVKNMLEDVTDILNDNPLIRTLIYTTSQISTTLETVLLFISMTSLIFFCLNCLNLDFFRLIGVGIFALMGSLVFLYGFLIVTNKFI